MLPPRILVTGANGLVGQAVVRAAARWPGADVLATGRGAAVGHARGGYARLDVLDDDAVERMMQDFAPNAVVHAAGQALVEPCEADREACWALNVDAVARLAAACHRHGARLVVPSTDFVFSGEGGPYAEADRPEPVNAYGRSKLAAENALAGSRCEWAVARTTMVFGVPAGPAPRLDLVRRVVRDLSAGHRLLVAEDQWRTPTYDDDLADGLLRIVRFRRNGVFHVAGREFVSVLDLARLTAEAFGLDASLLDPTTTAALHPGAPRPLRAGLLILRAETELGYRPRPLAVALRETRRRMAEVADVRR